MHPRSHFLLTALAAGAAGRRLGPRALAFWAGGVLADSDHLLWHAQHTGRLDLTAAWAHFADDGAGDDAGDGDDAGAGARERPARRLPLHRWRFIVIGLALGPRLPWVGAFAAGLAFHRVLDDLDDRFGPWWRARPVRRRQALHAAVFRRAGQRCEACGAAGVKLEAHHRVQREAGGRDTAENLVALCVPCHRSAHR